jgi:hypothetical protein
MVINSGSRTHRDHTRFSGTPLPHASTPPDSSISNPSACDNDFPLFDDHSTAISCVKRWRKADFTPPVKCRPATTIGPKNWTPWSKLPAAKTLNGRRARVLDPDASENFRLGSSDTSYSSSDIKIYMNSCLTPRNAFCIHSLIYPLAGFNSTTTQQHR